MSIIAAMPDALSPAAAPPLHLVVMGVAGCGKSVVGEQLSESLALPFLDADNFHPQGSVEKIERDQPLDATDHAEWLQRCVQELGAQPLGAILSCPALRRADREALRAVVPRLRFLYLALTPHQAMERAAARTDQFYPPSLVGADFDALEDPAREPDVLAADGLQHVDRIVEAALRWLESRALAYTRA
ncbi:gluconokinase, GntK/IdnK-type [Ramlibacter monticola]|uniref:Gluconokinase n=1 Tax=Ramlibacter monticola TaxID=1926872 RepID=A0A937CUQ8_9BURK|nr:gluconokinase, GntK/IdnK-type [Ramlibacter monticola]MBL0392973.1 AAA family ATPase [Ramlibacter monticola]